MLRAAAVPLVVEASSLHLSRDLRVVATRDGAIVSTSKGCFRLDRSSAARFLSEVLPALYLRDGGRIPPGILALEQSLCNAGICAGAYESDERSPQAAGPTRVSIHRTTPLALRVAALLDSAGIEIEPRVQDGDFVVSDLSDFSDDASLDIVSDLHRRRCVAIFIWRRGEETLIGPMTVPGKTACWHCAHNRLSDSLHTDIKATVDDPSIARVVCENVILGVRYPSVAGYGCLIAESESSSVHAILPMPWCSTCGGPPDTPLASINHSAVVPESMRLLADPRTGVIRQLLVFERANDESPVMPACASALIALPRVRAGDQDRILRGEGKGATRDEAILGAIGEGLERYCASLWNPTALIEGSPQELGDRAFDLNWLVLYNAEQYAKPGFGFVPVDSNAPLHWLTGSWLDTGGDVLLPAQATYLGFRDEVPVAQVTSNGLAAGTSFEDAALRATYEIIERDAFMLYWLAGMSGERLDPAGCDTVTHEALGEAARLGARTELYLLDVVGIPTIACIGLGDGVTWPGATIGLGTHVNIDSAIRKAALEHGHFGPYMRRLMWEGQHTRVLAPDDVLGSLDHGLYYCHVANVAGLQRLRSQDLSSSLSHLRERYSMASNLAGCIARLSESGIRMAAVDLTTPDVALTGLRVVRTFGTFAQPIHFGFGYERAASPRLRSLLTAPIRKLPHPIA